MTVYTGDEKDNSLFGGVEDDEISGLGGNDNLHGGVGDDVCDGGDGNDRLVDGEGKDVLIGGAGNDTIALYDENVQIDAGSGNDTIFGNPSSDKTAVDELIEGEDGDDGLYGSGGDDEISGGSGEDLIFGGSGSDTIDGGTGNDNLRSHWVIDGRLGNPDNYYDFDPTNKSASENYFRDDYEDVLSGNAGADTIKAMPGDDLFGGDDNDSLQLAAAIESGAPSTIINGGGGVDAASFDISFFDAAVKLTAGATVSLPGNVTLAGVEQVDIRTGSGNDTMIAGDYFCSFAAGAGRNVLIGGKTVDWLSAGADDDSITGNGGDDIIGGGNGANTLTGGTGNDFVQGGADRDTIDSGDGNDTIDAQGGDDKISTAGGNDTVSAGDGADSIEGGSGDDILYGETISLPSKGGNDTIRAGDGDDSVGAGGGNDTIELGLGNDSLTGGFGLDSLYYSSSAWAIDADLATGKIKVANDLDEVDEVFNIDVLIATSLGDRIIGGNIRETIEAGAGNDTVEGGDASDKSDGADSIDGSIGHDSLSGGVGKDTIIGGAGNDTVESGFGYDQTDGGTGIDLVVFSRSSLGVVVDLGLGTVDFIGDDQQGLPETAISFENVIGTALADRLEGSIAKNVLDGGKGDDVLTAVGSTGDSLLGGDGNDTLTGGAFAGKADTLDGGIGDDSINAADNAVVASGKSGRDTVAGGVGDDSLDGGTENDGVGGGAGDDTLIGGAGNDTLQGGDGLDKVDAGIGLDRIIVGSWDKAAGAKFEFIDGGTGIDLADFSAIAIKTTINLTLAGADERGVTIGAASGAIANIENVLTGKGNDKLTGTEAANNLNAGAGNDYLLGDSGNDTLTAGIGNDTLSGGLGIDTLDGGAGLNLADFSTSIAAFIIDLAAGTALSGGETDKLIGIAQVIATNLNDRIAGSDLNNLLRGQEGDDTIEGGAGNDQLLGEGGNDVLKGGLGNDTINGGADLDRVDFSASDKSVSASLATGTAFGEGSDRLIAVETILGSAHSDTLTGNDLDNTLQGAAGNDTINGGLGDDTLNGGVGLDTLTYAKASAGVSVNLTTGKAAGGAGSDRISLFESIVATALADTVLGGAAAERIAGGSGNDLLDGKAGADTMEGGAGNDTMTMNAAGDRIVEALNAGIDLVQSSVNCTLAADVENLTLIAKASTGTGNGLDNEIIGTAGANKLDGGEGNDRLNGKGGGDTLTGGAGDDLFIVDAVADKVMEVFNEGLDRVESSVGYKLANHVEELTLTGTSAVSAVGNTLDNRIIGNEADNEINGSTGNDTVTGGEGADVFVFNAAIGPGDRITDFTASEDVIELSRTLFSSLGPDSALAESAFRVGTKALDADDRIIFNDADGTLIYDANGNAAGGAVKFATLAGFGGVLSHTDFSIT